MNAQSAARPPMNHPAALGATIMQGAVLGLGLALVANTVLYLLGNLGSPIRVVTGWAPDGANLRLSEVIVTSAVSVLAGALVLWVLERRRKDGFRVWVGLASAVAVLSALPLFRLDIDAGSKAALSSMHIVTASSAIAAQAIVRRRRR